VNCDEIDRDTPTLSANKDCCTLSRVSCTLAQISCYITYDLFRHETAWDKKNYKDAKQVWYVTS